MKIARLLGIDINVHWSWLILFLILVYSTSGYYSGWGLKEGREEPIGWLFGMVGALLLFASVLVHELAHSLMAKSFGIEVHSISLFLFGGVSDLEVDDATPRQEFFITIVGPVSSAVLSGIFFLGLYIAGTAGFGFLGGGEFSYFITLLAVYLAVMNAAIVVFNILPAFPLDGGRVLVSILEWGGIKKVTATKIAVYTSYFLCFALAMLGLYLVVLKGDYSGAWLMVVSVFVLFMARNGMREARRQNMVVSEKFIEYLEQK